MRFLAFPAGVVWLAILIHSIIVFGAALLPWPHLPMHLATGFINPGTELAPELIQRFLRWDAHWYTYVAQNGYDDRTIVFFPMLILLIRAVSGLAGLDYGTAGWLVSNLFAVLSMFAMYALFRLDLGRRQAGQALFAYALFPTSMFLNSVYTEPLFITFTAGCVYCVRTRRWVAAGLLAAMATLTRNIGVFLFLLMAWEFGRDFTRHRRRIKLWTALPAPIALGGFMLFNYFLAGDIVAFANAQRGWGRQFGWPWDNFANGIRLLETGPVTSLPGAYLDVWLVGIGLLLMLLKTLAPNLRLRGSYLLIGWLWLVLPMFSTAPWLPLYSMSRFCLVVFPLYYFAGRLPRFLFLPACLASAVALAICTALFTRWYWIG